MLGDSRIPRAASEQFCYILLCRLVQQAAISGQDFPQVRGKLFQIGREEVCDKTVPLILLYQPLKVRFAFSTKRREIGGAVA